MSITDQVQCLSLGDFPLEGGEVLPAAQLTYRVIGEPCERADNLIVLPTYYTGNHESYDALIGLGKALDPTRWCIVIPNMFGNGRSTSPSNWSGQGAFPTVSVADNVRAQRTLIEERFGSAQLALVAGWSMGAMQAWAWAALYPEAVKRLLPLCGGARCWPLNRVFLEGMKAVLCVDRTQRGLAGLRAFGRAYAGWAYSAAFYREERWRELGFDSLEALLASWEDDHARWHPEDLLAMLETWRTADLTPFLARVSAQTLVMPCNTDSYFTEDEIRLEARLVSHARVKVIASSAGHCAGAPGRFRPETELISQALQELLHGT